MLWKTKTFWVGVATTLGGVGGLIGADIKWDFASVTAAIATVEVVFKSPYWISIMLGIGMITGRQALNTLSKNLTENTLANTQLSATLSKTLK